MISSWRTKENFPEKQNARLEAKKAAKRRKLTRSLLKFPQQQPHYINLAQFWGINRKKFFLHKEDIILLCMHGPCKLSLFYVNVLPVSSEQMHLWIWFRFLYNSWMHLFGGKGYNEIFFTNSLLLSVFFRFVRFFPRNR